MIEIALRADKPLTTADLSWFMDAVNGASGHSGEDVPIFISASAITAQVPSGDEPEPKEDRPLQAGDRVRVLMDGADHAPVKAGDVLMVKEAASRTTGRIKAFRPDAGGDVWFLSPENVERV